MRETTPFLNLVKRDTGDTPGGFLEDFARNMEILDDFARKQSFVFIQDVPRREWVIVHNLNRKPAVTIVDSANNVVVGDVTYVDDTTIVVTFSGEFSGRCYLN